LKIIKECAEKAEVNKYGWKRISIYYTGHGYEPSGDWAFPDGAITLQDIVD